MEFTIFQTSIRYCMGAKTLASTSILCKKKKSLAVTITHKCHLSSLALFRVLTILQQFLLPSFTLVLLPLPRQLVETVNLHIKNKWIIENLRILVYLQDKAFPSDQSTSSMGKLNERCLLSSNS